MLFHGSIYCYMFLIYISRDTIRVKSKKFIFYLFLSKAHSALKQEDTYIRILHALIDLRKARKIIELKDNLVVIFELN